MPVNRNNLAKIITLLYVAGFLVMLGFGFMGIAHFVMGLILYGLGALLSFRVRQSSVLKSLGVATLILFLINLVFFSSTELLPLLDVSFAIYLVLLGNLVLLCLFNRKLDPWPFPLPYMTWIVIFLASIVLSATQAAHTKEAIYFFVINFGAVVGFYAVISLFRDSRKSLLTVVKWLAGLGVVSAALAIWQLYSGSFKFLFYPLMAIRDQKILELWEVVSRVAGTWQHPSYLGIYLALAILLAVYLMFYAVRHWTERIFWALSIVFMASALLLTNTRSSVLAGLFGVGLIYVFANFDGREFLRRLPGVKKIVVLGLLATGALLLYQFVFVSEIYTKPQAYRVDASATIWGRFLRSDTMSTESLIQRSQLYELAWQKFQAAPVFGMGAKNFQFEVAGMFERGTDAHNLILQTLAEMGVVGLIATGLLYGALLRAVYVQLGSTTSLSKKYLQATLFAAMLLILFDSLFNNPMYSLRLVAIFWLFVAMSHINYQSLKISAQS